MQLQKKNRYIKKSDTLYVDVDNIILKLFNDLIDCYCSAK